MPTKGYRLSHLSTSMRASLHDFTELTGLEVYSLDLSGFKGKMTTKVAARVWHSWRCSGRDSTGLLVSSKCQLNLVCINRLESKGEETATEMMTAKIQKRKIGLSNCTGLA